MSTPDSRRNVAHLGAARVNRSLSAVIGQLDELARITMTSEFNTVTLELDKIRNQVTDIAGRVK